MQNVAVVALALLESASAFQAPAMKASTKAVAASMFSEGDIGVLPPLGVYDPLGLIETKDMRRYEIMEIKHGRGECSARAAHRVCQSPLPRHGICALSAPFRALLRSCYARLPPRDPH